MQSPHVTIHDRGPSAFLRVSLDLPISCKHRKRWWLASCKALDVHSQGPSRADAEANLGEAVQLYMDEWLLHSVGDRP